MEEVGVKLGFEGADAFFSTLEKANKAIDGLGVKGSPGLRSFEKEFGILENAARNAIPALEGAAKATTASGESAANASGLYQDAAGRWRTASGRFASDAEKAAVGVESIPKAARKIPDGLKAAESGFNAFEEVVTGALRRVGELLVNVGIQGAQAIAGFAKDSIDAAASFESGLNEFAAAAGGSLEAAGLDVEDFSKLFLEMGKKLPVSTAEVEQAAIALVKGGLDPAIIAAGGLESSLNFAAGAGMGLEAAAELGVKMLGTFTSVTDSAATKTAFLAEAQDLLVKAAGASTLNVDQLGDAMLAAGGQAKAVGLEYKDFVTTMGLISPSFGSAAEAGTSFKNFLTRLAPSTKPAKEAMADLGLMTTSTTKIMQFLADQGIKPLGTDLDTLGNQFTEFATSQGFTAKETTKVWDSFSQSKFFDETTGNFIGVEKSAQLLKESLSGLSDVQRVQALQQIFGNDAMGAAAALADGGAEAYRAFAEQMEKANGVQKQAEAVQKGFAFAVDQAKGSLETLQIVLGMKLLPVLASLINTYLTPAINLATDFAQAIFGDIDAFMNLPGPIQAAANLISGFFSYLNTGALDAFALGIVNTFGGDALLPILGFIDGVRNGFSIFGQVLSTLPLPSFSGLMQSIGNILAVVLPPITSFIGGLAETGQMLLDYNVPLGTFASLLLGANPIIAIAVGLFQHFSEVLPPISDVMPILITAFERVSNAAQGFIGLFTADTMAEATQSIFALMSAFGIENTVKIVNFVNILKGAADFLANNWQSAVVAAGAILATVLAPGIAAGAAAFAGVLIAAAPVIGILALVGAAAMALKGAWDQNFGGIQEKTAAAMTAVQAVIQSVMAAVLVFWQNNGAEIMAFAQQAWGQIQEIIGGIVNVIMIIVQRVFGAIQSFLTEHGDIVQQVLEGAWEAISGIIQMALDSIQSIVNIALDLLNGDFKGAWDELVKGVVTFVGNLGTVFNGLWKMIQPGIQAAWDSFKKSVNPLGRDVISGILQGIEQNASRLFDSLRNLATNALTAAKNALHIGSPSKLFADEVGKPVSEGISVGIDKGSNTVNDAVIRVGDGAISAIQKPITDGAFQIQGEAIGESITTGVRKKKKRVSEAAQSVVQEAALDLEPIIGSFFAAHAGEPMSMGIAQGILSASGYVTSAIDSLSKDTVKSLADMADKAASAMEEALSGRVGLIRGQLGANDFLEGLYGKQEDVVVRMRKIGEANDEITAQIAEAGKSGTDFSKIMELQAKKTSNNNALSTLRDEYSRLGTINNRVQILLQEAQTAANEIARTDATAAKDYMDLRKNQIAELEKYEQKVTDASKASATGAKDRAIANLAAVKQAQALELQQLRDSTAQRARELAAQGDMKSTGNAVVDGIIKGIQERSADLAAALGTAMGSALATAQKSLGIHSPSTVFALKVGQPISEGIAMGIDQAMGSPLSAINSLTSSLIRPAAPAVAGRSGGSTNINQSWNYSPTYQGSPPNPSSDFSAMRVMATAR